MARQITFPVEFTVTLDDDTSERKVKDTFFQFVTELIEVEPAPAPGTTPYWVSLITLDHTKIVTKETE
jgi:hypothetical protein